jgi:DNA modification methylase
MTTAPSWRNASSALYVGDARDVLAAMPDQSADCIVTSPPYWAKRDYGVPGQYGHEHTPAAYVATLRDA